MKPQSNPDWQAIRKRASMFPEAAFQFVREGLTHTSRQVHGEHGDDQSMSSTGAGRHVSGQQLCIGLGLMAQERFGLLAGAVMRRWGIRRTEDFGVIVYAMIDRGEMRCGPNDSFDDFREVFEFNEIFEPVYAPNA